MKAASARDLLDKLLIRKRGYQQAFAPGAPGHAALVDACRFSRAFGGEVIPGDHDRTLILAGRREVCFRILDHLYLEPDEIVELYKAVKRTGEE